MKRAAVSVCILVALIWGSSLILVKLVLIDVDPLTLAGLRYSIGAMMLLPFMGEGFQRLRKLPPGGWFRLILLGIFGYALANLAIFKAMETLPAAMGSVGMNLLPVIVLLIGMLQLQEVPRRRQVGGMVMAALGGMCFFTLDHGHVNSNGLIYLAAGVLGHGVFSVIGRRMASRSGLHTIELTAMPLWIGGSMMLLLALGTQGLPEMPMRAWWAVLWLALVNTAVAYGLYNYALRTLRAFEVNVLLNLAPVASAGLAWVVFGETLADGQLVGMASLICGVALVQLG
jgi:probable blue pigment (indigoidine) exporter